jgi:hypothetical protein
MKGFIMGVSTAYIIEATAVFLGESVTAEVKVNPNRSPIEQGNHN